MSDVKALTHRFADSQRLSRPAAPQAGAAAPACLGHRPASLWGRRIGDDRPGPARDRILRLRGGRGGCIHGRRRSRRPAPGPNRRPRRPDDGTGRNRPIQRCGRGGAGDRRPRRGLAGGSGGAIAGRGPDDPASFAVHALALGRAAGGRRGVPPVRLRARCGDHRARLHLRAAALRGLDRTRVGRGRGPAQRRPRHGRRAAVRRFAGLTQLARLAGGASPLGWSASIPRDSGVGRSRPRVRLRNRDDGAGADRLREGPFERRDRRAADLDPGSRQPRGRCSGSGPGAGGSRCPSASFASTWSWRLASCRSSWFPRCR